MTPQEEPEYMSQVRFEADLLAYGLQARHEAEERIANGEDRIEVGQEMLRAQPSWNPNLPEEEEIDAMRRDAAVALVARELLGINLGCRVEGGPCTCPDRDQRPLTTIASICDNQYC